ncbi:dihydrofolate synthetase Fol3 [Ascosphaera apis ARSEF 7405]|uniref:Dihydrofolate synthetase n=1 Tax=Ascosphaera apis ARSEF 7405 TaxID=392613 RepID=A0A167V385_9EURO|nr:dihydrofolate synthetase Fol3 [Ascosphaera apis ARSEF 7405]
MIELGLQRISRLVQHCPPISWKAVHIAGTNGKGSIVSYISSLFAHSGIRCGAFTSPHLVDRWDCITIDNNAVKQSVFLAAEEKIKQVDRTLGVGASEFELLTATAFQIFEQEKIDIGVIEVGLGGRLDATNVLTEKDVLVSVVSKIGLDHQKILGDSLEQIAREKAGIMKKNVACVVDATNETGVMNVLRKCADNAGTRLIPVTTDSATKQFNSLSAIFDSVRLEPHQQTNASVAVTAAQLAISLHRPQSTKNTFEGILSKAITACPRPGRQQLIDLRPLVSRAAPVLLDGAHNPQSAVVLGQYVESRIRRDEKPLVWILAMSEGKSMDEILDTIIRPNSGDYIATVEFGAVDGMPWVRPCESTALAGEVSKVQGLGEIKSFGADLKGALRWAEGKAVALGTNDNEGSIVIAGSLYLVGSVLRELREAGMQNGN